MVAYSFKSAFVPDIRSGVKRQTIRLPRKRHARPGEFVQLYQGMRTRTCEKIVPDPRCVGLDEVRIDLRRFDDALVAACALDGVLQVNGIPLFDQAADDYARSDGFAGVRCKDLRACLTPFRHMMRWWIFVHGYSLFEGVAIRWEPAP